MIQTLLVHQFVDVKILTRLRANRFVKMGQSLRRESNRPQLDDQGIS